MNINDSPEQARFRAQVRAWIDQAVPPALKGQRLGIATGSGPTPEELRPLEAALARQGWLAPAWPCEYGGAGFDVVQMVIFEEELLRAGIRPSRNLNGINMLGPILIKWGTEEQKRRFLGPTLRREIFWAQGYSEPNAGSDLANLALRADAVEGGFLLNGQKTWTSRAHFADWIFLLARSDPQARPKQKGISFLLVERRSPGITVRPVPMIDGAHHFNETFYENVFVPHENLVGRLHEGWQVAKALLGYERFTQLYANPVLIQQYIDDVKRAARTTPQGDGVVWDDPRLRRVVSGLEMDTACMHATRLRALSRIARGEAPGPETMIFKQFGGELLQRVVDLHQRVLGGHGVLWDGASGSLDVVEVGKHSAHIRQVTIGGGTAEVHRNIIAKHVLGLPD
ncbi:MAG: acyl-CoA dehydrogenase family protein [Candidatus Lambdaproteobacteria bacterium]|nr:acyl-CoA dehydrogenase family protein [Candidatus Lambdaproteobacteria bacterium]